jgi:hypothetical protein
MLANEVVLCGHPSAGQGPRVVDWELTYANVVFVVARSGSLHSSASRIVDVAVETIATERVCYF